MIIQDGQRLNSAMHGNYEIPVYDDGFGQLYILRDSLGIRGICRARNWETAYEICEDEILPEADETLEELEREYGFKREHYKVVKDSSVLTATEGCSAGERFERFPEDYPDGKLAPEFVRWETV